MLGHMTICYRSSSIALVGSEFLLDSNKYYRAKSKRGLKCNSYCNKQELVRSHLVPVRAMARLSKGLSVQLIEFCMLRMVSNRHMPYVWCP
jgi:hypothetical protein